jgi:flagellar biosynthesis/type III secretory pathway protein FliH
VKGVIKQGEFVSVVGTAPPAQGMKTPTRSISNGDKSTSKSAEAEDTVAAKKSARELEEQRRIEEQNAKFEAMRAECAQECSEKLNSAEQEALRIIDEADGLAQSLRDGVEQDCSKIRATAEKKGYNDGFKSGEKPGYDAGFEAGKAECKAALSELTAILNGLNPEKEKIFKEYENQLFDLIFTISNKITVGSLNQKDKSVISKMLKEAAKSFRGSDFIKVSLSKFDIEESSNVDLEDLKRILGAGSANSAGEKRHIEFEILKDAPKGTLILDNGSEITDAGISTQLKMIENLGKGKFKNKPEDDETNADGAVLEE